MAWWNSHQAFLLGPSLLSVFDGGFSLLPTSGMAIISLRSTRKLCLGGVFSLVHALVWGFLDSYGGYAPGPSSPSWPHVPSGAEDDLFPEVGDVCHSSTPDLAKRLWATSYQRVVEGSWQHSLGEGVHHHGFVLGV